MPARVRMHRDFPLQFPPVCILCADERPDSRVRVLEWSSAANVFSMHRFHAPACAACAQTIARHRTARRLWIVAGVLVGAGLIVALVALGNRVSQGWIMAVIVSAVGAMLLLRWWSEARYPLPVHVVTEGSRFQQLARANYVTLEFRDVGYARWFTQINQPGIRQ